MAAQIEARSSGGRTDYTISGDNEAEVQEAIDSLLRTYDPLGYGTRFGEIKKDGARYVASGHRYNTAD